ncbi:unnamed protein product [Vitrella brassicaformis CCMP3155]|uniref:Uncharacterized protein n=1 Tax=Vitrella brassicaformis (strain CCMP3155) TaxID=1169540 RepID=A0A0G4EI98_VITBC|nr:unnamed protein product [Vitrella brassicaformis CCMP3155]|eukprot:CEL95728.1 unnamed protein product [Vitrella brassicaformis CCMP3155]
MKPLVPWLFFVAWATRTAAKLLPSPPPDDEGVTCDSPIVKGSVQWLNHTAFPYFFDVATVSSANFSLCRQWNGQPDCCRPRFIASLAVRVNIAAVLISELGLDLTRTARGLSSEFGSSFAHLFEDLHNCTRGLLQFYTGVSCSFCDPQYRSYVDVEVPSTGASGSNEGRRVHVAVAVKEENCVWLWGQCKATMDKAHKLGFLLNEHQLMREIPSTRHHFCSALAHFKQTSRQWSKLATSLHQRLYRSLDAYRAIKSTPSPTAAPPTTPIAALRDGSDRLEVIRRMLSESGMGDGGAATVSGLPSGSVTMFDALPFNDLPFAPVRFVLHGGLDAVEEGAFAGIPDVDGRHE